MSIDQRDFDPELCGQSAAPYVLGALTEPEHEAFRRHLDSCAVCREEVASLQVVASALPAAAPQLSAPPELKRRLLASVHEDLARDSADAQRRARARHRHFSADQARAAAAT
jgi:anti-sigma-K factor RskA